MRRKRRRAGVGRRGYLNVVSPFKVAATVGFPLPIDDVTMPPAAFGALYRKPFIPHSECRRHVPERGFRRFTICHELGHLFLDGHLDELFEAIDRHFSETGQFHGVNESWFEEIQADTFAAELLVPTGCRPGAARRRPWIGRRPRHRNHVRDVVELRGSSLRGSLGNSVAVILSRNAPWNGRARPGKCGNHW